MSSIDIAAILLSLKLAAVTTLILLVLGTPLAWWLSQTRFRGKFLLETVIALPLVLPPTVIGFYLLIALSPQSIVGQLLSSLGLTSLVFSFTGLVFASVIYSLPFVVQPLQAAFAAIGHRPMDVAATLGASPVDRFFTIAMPMAWPGYLSAAALGFAHTLGEFGVVLMIGGNIPGETQTASIAIYEQVESLQYQNAHWLAGILLLLSFITLSLVYGVRRRVRWMS